MPDEQEFLLYPIDTGEDPVCLRCASKMLLAGSGGTVHPTDLPLRPLWPIGKIPLRRLLGT